MSQQYIGSQEHFEDEINAYYEQKEAYENSMEQDEEFEYYDDEAEDDLSSLAEDCTCGAYVMGKDGKWKHVSDCCC